jgi:hypothetical protein
MNGIIVEYIIFYTKRARPVNNLEHTERHFKFLPYISNVCTMNLQGNCPGSTGNPPKCATARGASTQVATSEI